MLPVNNTESAYMLYVKLVNSVPLIPVILKNINVVPADIVSWVPLIVCPDVIGSGNGFGV